MLCLVLGHHYIRAFEGRRAFLRCLRCLAETEGWALGEATAPIIGTQTYWDEVYAEFMETELALHGGG